MNCDPVLALDHVYDETGGASLGGIVEAAAISLSGTSTKVGVVCVMACPMQRAGADAAIRRDQAVSGARGVA